MKKNIMMLIFSLFAISINAQTIELKDANLTNCVKTYLNLGSTEPISTLHADTITCIECIEAGIIDISDIYKFPNLVKLDLSNNKIKDVSSLENLPNLEFVNLSNNEIETVTSIMFAQTDSMRINIHRNFIKDINILADSRYLYADIIGKNTQLSPNDTIKTKVYQFEVSQDIENSNICIIKYRCWSNVSKDRKISFGDGEQSELISDGFTHKVEHIYSEAGTFDIELLGDDLYESKTFTAKLTAINDLSENKNINIYPNPNKGKVFLTIDDYFNKEIKIVLTDLSGKVLFSDKFVNNKESKMYDFRNYSKGLYLININIDNVIYTKKIMIE